MKDKNYLAIDWGERYWGVAWGNQYLADPLTTLSQPGFEAKVQELKQIVEQYLPDKIIIGKSTTAQSDLTDQLQQLVDLLVKQWQIDVELWQEDYSTRTASYLARQAGKKMASLGQQIHSLSAAVILQDYLDQHAK